MAILSYIFLLEMTVAFNCLIKNLTLANILVKGLLNSLSLLIFRYIRSFWRNQVYNTRLNLQAYGLELLLYDFWFIFIDDIIKQVVIDISLDSLDG